MPTLQALERQVQGTEDLQSIVKAMKSISAARIRQFRGAVESLDSYSMTLALGLQIALRTRRTLDFVQPGVGAPRVAIVFGSDQGLVGQFNARVLDFALEQLDDGGKPVTFFAVGSRLARQVESGGRTVVERHSAPSSVEAIARLVQDLLVAIEHRRDRRATGRFTVFWNHYTGGASYKPRRAELLPFDPDWLTELRTRRWDGPSLPTFRTKWRDLFASLVREYLFIVLYRACAESLASENASRLAAMESAETRVEERLSELQQQLNVRRQQEITQELLEVVAGFTALESEKG